MPTTEVLFFVGVDGTVPVRDWLAELHRHDMRAHARCLVRLRRLAAVGHELRRPEADILRDGIYELRVRNGHVHYRILYFFHGSHVAVLAHALVKGAVPEAAIRRALERKGLVEADPDRYLQEDWS